MKFLLPQFFAFLITLNMLSCSSIQKTQISDITSGLEELNKGNMTDAKNIFQKQCDLGERSACAQLGLILGKEYKHESAYSLFNKACDLGELRSCSTLGFIYLEQGKIKEAKKLFKKSEKDSLQARLFLSLVNLIEKNTEEAKKQAEAICNDQFTYGCMVRGIIAEYEHDFISAKKYYSQATGKRNTDDTDVRLGIIELILGNRQSGETLINQSCIGNDAKACRIETLLQMEAKNTSLGNTLRTKCEKKDKDACYYLGLKQSLSQTTINKSNKFFKKACDLGNGFGCIEFANLLIPYSNPSLEIKIINESCIKGAGSTCSLMYTKHYTNNESLSISLLEKGCSLGDGNSCFILANHLWHNDKKDEALSKYHLACKNNFMPGCFWTSKLSNKTQNEKDDEFKKLCLKGFGEACENFAYTSKKNGNLSLANDYYQKACNLKYLGSCYESIEIESSLNKSYDKVEALSRMCDQKYAPACYFAGEHFKTKGDIQKSKEIFSKGCFLGESGSCAYLGTILKDESKLNESIEMFHKACDLGSIFGCRKYLSKI